MLTHNQLIVAFKKFREAELRENIAIKKRLYRLGHMAAFEDDFRGFIEVIDDPSFQAGVHYGLKKSAGLSTKSLFILD